MSVGARVFAMLILGLPAVVLGDSSTLLALVAVAAVWLGATVADRVAVIGFTAVLVEAGLVGLVAGISLDGRLTLVAALAVPPFTGALRRGVMGLALAISVEMIALVAVAWPRYGELAAGQAASVITSVLTGLGLGLIASYVNGELQRPPDPLAPYRDAQRLLRDLIDLSGNLGSGLDASALGNQIAVAVRDELPLRAVAVHVPRQDQLAPLVTGAMDASTDDGLLDDVARAAQTSRTQQVDGLTFAIPLLADDAVVGVVSGLLPPGLDPQTLLTTGRLEAIRSSLAATAVHLDTALLFSKLRDTAMADERRRLAREMHDGVAQDIASLGYLVDALAAAPSSAGQAETLNRLRERITAVVAEVRRSVQTLRTDAESSESLGAAISGLARHLSESSGIPIRVTVNEKTSRLRSEVESELLRIAQEAMTNAVRHSGASRIDVTCRVSAPAAELVIRDDGHGLGTARPDSFGLQIMRERAALVDADLDIESLGPHGTIVSIRLPGRHPRTTPRPLDTKDKVST